VTRLSRYLATLPTEEKYAFVAKSVRTIIVPRMIERGEVQPEFCVYAGTNIKGLPLNQENDPWEYHQLFNGNTVPTVFVQNQTKRFVNERDLEKALNLIQMKKYQVV
jgi:hypothetical protein